MAQPSAIEAIADIFGCFRHALFILKFAIVHKKLCRLTRMKISPQLRQEYDITFMQLITFVRAEVLAVKPMENAGPIAAMFFKEAIQTVLRELAELTAAWNKAQIDLEVVERALKALKELGLENSIMRLEQLKELK